MRKVNRVRIARFLMGLVVFINLQSALVFFIKPERFAPAYELTGTPGEVAIRGFAVLFVMWNVPYIVALINPLKYRVSLYEAIAMQSIGLAGESFILWTLPAENIILRGSILRFIAFDGGGLIALIAAARITKSQQRGNPT